MSDEDDAAVEDEVHPATSLPLTKEVRGVKKRFYRTRAHSNPLNDGHYPILPLCPEAMDWSHQFCGYTADFAHREWFVDVGSGYGGLLAAMAPLYPDAWLVGLEIRERVMEFCEAKLAKLRSEGNGQYDNVTYIRTNAMRFMPNFFKKSQISKMFFCYSDPHFKKKKWRQRIISHQLLAEYAYVLKPGAIVYTVTDVKDLHLWTVRNSPHGRQASVIPSELRTPHCSFNFR